MKWLVNDQLGALGEKTFWHTLLELGLEDRTGGYTPFNRLADKIEMEAASDLPRLIIRNGTYFRTINLPVRTISFVQDVTSGRAAEMQRAVMDSSDVVVFNSEYTRLHVASTKTPHVTVPIGVDFDLFRPAKELKWTHKLPQDTVLFVGAASDVKGWEFLVDLIEETRFHFAIVAKDGAGFEHPRVTNFGRVSQETLVEIMNNCAALVCTSKTETQHLAGIEAAACGLPLIVPNVGIYYDDLNKDVPYGEVVERSVSRFALAIHKVLAMRDRYAPREHFLSKGCDKVTCMNRWKELIA